MLAHDLCACARDVGYRFTHLDYSVDCGQLRTRRSRRGSSNENKALRACRLYADHPPERMGNSLYRTRPVSRFR